MENETEIQLYDTTTDMIYNIIVTPEEYKRAHHDMVFAQTLLNKKKQAEKENISEKECEPTDKDDGTQDKFSINVKVEGESENLTKPDIRHIWQYDETVSLINSMESHYDNLNHPVKRKYVFNNIANDLSSIGYAVDAVMCQTKWKTLVRSYKQAKDNVNKTGRGPSRFHFFDLMDNILGNKPSNKCEHTLDSSNVVLNLKELPESSAISLSESEEEIPTKKQRLGKYKKDPFKLKAEERREQRHQEKMELLKAKIAIEEKKVALIEKMLK